MHNATKLNLTRTQFELLKLALKVLPLVTTIFGALSGYVQGQAKIHDILVAMHATEGAQNTDGFLLHVLLEHIVIGSALGLTGGIVLSCFGLVLLDCIVVVAEPVKRFTRDTDTVSGVSRATGIPVYYKKQDVDEHERSTQKVAEKYDAKRQKEEAETKEILEIGTVGIREKKLGKKITKKTDDKSHKK